MGQAVAVGLGVAFRWALLYAGLSFVTQLWAGSQYSVGQGGGLDELVRWAAIFGVVVVVACVERVINGTRVVDPGAVLLVVIVGHAVGTGIAIWWYTTKGGPQQNDWWVAPAVAALFAVLWVHLLAPRLPQPEQYQSEPYPYSGPSQPRRW